MSDELLIENIKALLHLNASNSLVPHGIGNHARDLLDASITSIARILSENTSLRESVSAKDLQIASLKEEQASGKAREDDAFYCGAKSRESEVANLTQQLAAANGRVERYRAAIQQTLDENGHLADGEVCTLTLLKRALSDLPEADKEK